MGDLTGCRVVGTLGIYSGETSVKYLCQRFAMVLISVMGFLMSLVIHLMLAIQVGWAEFDQAYRQAYSVYTALDRISSRLDVILTSPYLCSKDL